jgi:transposase-like protein
MSLQPMDGPAPIVRDTASASVPAAADEVRPGGGPQTAEGRARSRQNALRHGLTAETLVLQAFPEGEIERFHEGFQYEWQPATPTQKVLVAELARHAAALDRAQQMETAVLRQAARATLALSAFDNSGDDGRDCLLAGSVINESVERLTRYRRCHEKAFLASLTKLREVKAHPFQVPEKPSLVSDAFRTEAECEDYLRTRIESPEFRCPACGGGNGYWLSGRNHWQCGHCHRQSGLRAGTVMAQSRLPLSTWFNAIRLVLLDPKISTPCLAAALGIRRQASVRGLRSKIRAALQSQNASQLLAGLDQVFARQNHLSQAPLKAAILQNELVRPAAALEAANHDGEGG